jgi:type I restriction enzyme M protein
MSRLLLLRLLNVFQSVTGNTPNIISKQWAEPFAFLPALQEMIHYNSDIMLEPLMEFGIKAAHDYARTMPNLEQNLYTAFQEYVGRRSISRDNFLGIAHILEELPLSPEQAPLDKLPVHFAALGAAYEQTLSRFLGRTWSGYALTQKALVRLMVGLAHPQPGEQIYDPACGSARLLIGALEQAPDSNAVGIDNNPDTCTIGILNLLLHGHPDVPILQRNSLETYNLPLVPNILLADIPFGGRIGENTARMLEEQEPYVRTTDSALAFLIYTITQVKRGARAVITLSEGDLFRQNKAATEIRRYLVNESLLRAVISLPPGIFMPATSAKGNLLVLAPASRQQDDIWFYAFEEKRRTKEPLSELEIALCLEDFAKAKTSHNLGGRGWTRSAHELAQNSYNLQAKLPDRQDNQSVFPSDLPTQPLQAAVLLIDRGISHLREQTIYQADFEQLLERAEDEESRKATQAKWKPVIRVGDLTSGSIQKAEQLIDVTTIKRQADIPYIQPGDVLLSVDGNIGKVAVCTIRQEGMVFSSRLVRIRCDENLLPDFLAEYLRSSYVQDRLQNLASGTLSRRVQLSDIKQTPIPSISIAQQRAILARVEAGTALLPALRELFNNEVGVKDPFAAFITHLIHDNDTLQTLVAFQAKRWSLSADEVYQWLDWQASNIHLLSAPVIHGTDAENSALIINYILNDLSFNVNRLRDALSTPTIQARLDELDRIQASLRRVFSEFPSDILEPQIADLFQQAVDGLEAALVALSEPLLAGTRISVRIEPDVLPLREETFIQIVVDNTGPVSAYDIRVEIPALTGILIQGEEYSVIRIPKLMAQGGKYKKSYRVFSDKAALIKSTASWVAKDIHGGRREGEVPISFSFVDSPRKHSYVNIPRNPYITGTPVNGEEMFFGREDVIDFLKANLLGAHQNNVLLLEGNRRTGKSSVLKQVERRKLLKEAISVYIDCQGLGELTEQKLFFKIADHMAKSLQRNGIQVSRPQNTDINPDDAFWDFRQLLEQYLASTAERHIILLFDEFEYLDIAIKDRKLPERVMENLRHVFQHYERLGVVLTGSHRLTKLREEYWSALFGLTLRKDIGALDRRAAEELVTKPLQSLVQFTPEAVAYIVDLAACQPYFIQMIAHTLVSDLQQKQDTSLITPARVEVIVPSAIEAASEHLQYMMNHAKLPRQRAILAYIAKQQNADTPVTHQDLTNFLAIQEIVSNASLLAQDLELLRENDLIAMVKGGPQSLYRIPIELLRYWIQDHIDLDDVVARAATDV